MRHAAAILVSLGLGLGAAAAAPATDRALIVVELFTSQGCNSCPPADAFLGELAARPDIIALSLHVDYWDYIGWKDPFAQRAFTERQRAYSRALAQRYVYTPQMVIDGRLQGVGSDRDAVETLIRQAAKAQAAAATRPTLRRDGDTIRVEGGGPVSAVVWMALYDDARRTSVERGENAGRLLANHHVVREWRVLGLYDGTPVSLPLGDTAALETQGCAVVVQAETSVGPGDVLAAYKLSSP